MALRCQFERCSKLSRSRESQLLCAGHQALVDGLNNPVHQALALKAAEEGTVLLINRPHGSSQKPLLPLSQMLKTIAVVGPNGGCDSSESSPSYYQVQKKLSVTCISVSTAESI